MSRENKIQLFQKQSVRTHWDDEQEKWYFSVIDVVGILSESIDPQAYWRKLKQRLKKEGNESVTNCHALKMVAKDGKMRMTDVANTETLLRLIQSVPSPKAEASTTEISREKKPQGLDENKDIARKGGGAAKKARVEIEKQTGKSIITSKNAGNLLSKSKGKVIGDE